MRWFRNCFLIVICVPMLALAWSNSGHEIVAAIAYQGLTPHAKEQINQITQAFYHYQSPERRFLKAATLPDAIKEKGITKYDDWHYITYTNRVDSVELPSWAGVRKYNVAWAIVRCEKALAKSDLNPRERANYLAFLVHLVGDAHEPMHCISRYSYAFPFGDRGGNRYRIITARAKNLHTYWDQGLGLFFVKNHHYPLSNSAVEKMAAEITSQYPENQFTREIEEKDPYVWTKQCYELAKNYAYRVPINGIPSPQYVANGQRIVKQQLALAGYRLMQILNNLYGG